MPDTKFELRPTALHELKTIEVRKFEDERGFFVESYSRPALAALGVDLEFIQDNHSLSRAKGTLRGIHYQLPPFAQDKLVRVVRGKIWDVGVDLRKSSPTFGQWFGMELSAASQTQLLIPAGFGHGFVTLESDTEVIYKVTSLYSAEHDRGVAWDDPSLAIAWPLSEQPILSSKDRGLPLLADTQLFE
jgi:dTDP-4-dehydrorhamnose 3,5-epimerase